MNQRFDNRLKGLRARTTIFSRNQNVDGIIYAGDHHRMMSPPPTYDTALPLCARLLWTCLRDSTEGGHSPVRLPSYDTIQSQLGIGSRSTVAAALQVLKITRWLTQSPVSGKPGCTVAVLHDQPLTVRQAIELDPTYLAFLRRALRSPGEKTRVLAQRAWDEVQEAVPVPAVLPPHRPAEWVVGATDGREEWAGPDHRLPRPKRPSEEQPKASALTEVAAPVELVFHQEILKLSSAMAKVATGKLQSLPSEWRQTYLDELAASVLTRQETDNPIRSPIAYLQWMVNQYQKQGEHPLTGKGEQLSVIVAERNEARRHQEQSPIRNKLREVVQERHGIQRFIQKIIDHGQKPAAELQESLERMNAGIWDLQTQLDMSP